MKLAVFSGQYFCFDGKHYSTDEAFVKFVTSFYPYFENIIFCDAVIETKKTQPYVLDPTETKVCPLPYFNLYSLRSMLLSFPKIYHTISNDIWDWDIIWLHAPHPVSLIFARICTKLHKPFFLFIRQNLKAYVGYRNRGVKRMLAVSVAHILEYIFCRLFRDTLTFTVGKEIFDRYNKTGRRVSQAAVSLISEKDIVRTERKQLCDNPNQIRLLSVGRLEPEKGIIYLIRAVDQLLASAKFSVTLNVVGNGLEEKRLRYEVNKRRLSQYVHFLGHVCHGHALFNLYKESDVFVLPSLTEGWPQTLFEAMACGVPIVATRVGGIPHLIQHGRNGLLIDPTSPRQICEAIDRLTGDHELRKRLVSNGLTTVRNHTTEAQRQEILVQIEKVLVASHEDSVFL